MMDKERLEEIKKELELDWSDISYVVNQVDVKWLINRVEELEKQNKRYREAIERALDESGWGDEGNALHRTISILAKALEGDDD